ncbi:MAG: lysophospholipid acyltransferase family protein [Bacillota bacterium]
MLYSFLKYLFRTVLLLVSKVEVNNLENIPSSGPVLLASNHLSLWDPIVLGVVIPRKLHFMAKEELFNIFLIGSIIRKVGTFPVKRGSADRNAIKNSVKILKEGEVLCIFPEGTRSKTKELLPFQPGIVLIAEKGDSILIPVGIKGTNKILRKGFRPIISINIGEPIQIKDLIEDKLTSEKMEIISNRIQSKVKELVM